MMHALDTFELSVNVRTLRGTIQGRGSAEREKKVVEMRQTNEKKTTVADNSVWLVGLFGLGALGISVAEKGATRWLAFLLVIAALLMVLAHNRDK